MTTPCNRIVIYEKSNLKLLDRRGLFATCGRYFISCSLEHFADYLLPMQLPGHLVQKLEVGVKAGFKIGSFA